MKQLLLVRNLFAHIVVSPLCRRKIAFRFVEGAFNSLSLSFVGRRTIMDRTLIRPFRNACIVAHTGDRNVRSEFASGRFFYVLLFDRNPSQSHRQTHSRT